MNNLASININFDSIRWGFGIKNRNFTDLAFLHIADWFFEFSKSYYFKYTIFVIGQDMERPVTAEHIKYWSSQGHEIGNHSYTYPQNFLKDEKTELYTHQLSESYYSLPTKEEFREFIRSGFRFV